MKVNIQPTFSSPRCRSLRSRPVLFIQPNTSSIRLRFLWSLGKETIKYSWRSLFRKFYTRGRKYLGRKGAFELRSLIRKRNQTNQLQTKLLTSGPGGRRFKSSLPAGASVPYHFIGDDDDKFRRQI